MQGRSYNGGVELSNMHHFLIIIGLQAKLQLKLAASHVNDLICYDQENVHVQIYTSYPCQSSSILQPSSVLRTFRRPADTSAVDVELDISSARKGTAIKLTHEKPRCNIVAHTSSQYLVLNPIAGACIRLKITRAVFVCTSLRHHPPLSVDSICYGSSVFLVLLPT